MALTGLKNYCHLWMCSEMPGHCLYGLHWKFFETGIVSLVDLNWERWFSFQYRLWARLPQNCMDLKCIQKVNLTILGAPILNEPAIDKAFGDLWTQENNWLLIAVACTWCALLAWQCTDNAESFIYLTDISVQQKQLAQSVRWYTMQRSNINFECQHLRWSVDASLTAFAHGWFGSKKCWNAGNFRFLASAASNFSLQNNILARSIQSTSNAIISWKMQIYQVYGRGLHGISCRKSAPWHLRHSLINDIL